MCIKLFIKQSLIFDILPCFTKKKKPKIKILKVIIIFYIHKLSNLYAYMQMDFINFNTSI